ncbi:MAG: hypothetical protein AB1472_07210 [Candidatus Omnitrophota bacterium]
MSEEAFLEKKEDSIAIHIFSVSAAMVGVCLTVIGILSLIHASTKVDTLGDDITALDSITFLASCIISYIAIKTKMSKRRLLLEKIADSIFLTGLALSVLVCIFIVYKAL